ncbi:hypothetical protein [Methylobacterium sp. JK268]
MTDWPYAHLDRLCDEVGLRRLAALPASERTRAAPPADAAMWSGSYAMVVLWPVGAADALATAAADGQAWLDAVLSAAEGGKLPIDGYLVLALPGRPGTAEGDGLVRRLEASTHVCRKHVIWPDGGSTLGWRGLVAVSALGFPAAPAARVVTQGPGLDPEVAALWARIQAHGHAKAAAEDGGRRRK